MLSGQDKYKLAVTEWKEDSNRAEKEADEIIKKDKDGENIGN